MLTVENGAVQGGFGSALTEALEERGFHPVICRAGLPDRFIEHATVAEQQAMCGLDKESLRRRILELTTK